MRMVLAAMESTQENPVNWYLYRQKGKGWVAYTSEDTFIGSSRFRNQDNIAVVLTKAISGATRGDSYIRVHLLPEDMAYLRDAARSVLRELRIRGNAKETLLSKEKDGLTRQALQLRALLRRYIRRQLSVVTAPVYDPNMQAAARVLKKGLETEKGRKFGSIWCENQTDSEAKRHTADGVNHGDPGRIKGDVVVKWCEENQYKLVFVDGSAVGEQIEHQFKASGAWAWYHSEDQHNSGISTCKALEEGELSERKAYGLLALQGEIDAVIAACNELEESQKPVALATDSATVIKALRGEYTGYRSDELRAAVKTRKAVVFRIKGHRIAGHNRADKLARSRAKAELQNRN